MRIERGQRELFEVTGRKKNADEIGAEAGCFIAKELERESRERYTNENGVRHSQQGI